MYKPVLAYLDGPTDLVAHDGVKVRFSHDALRKYLVGGAYVIGVKMTKSGYYTTVPVNLDPYQVDPKDLDNLSVSQILDKYYPVWLGKPMKSPETPVTSPNVSFEVPKIPDGVFVSKDNWTLLNTAFKIQRIPLILGPKGAGKSTICKALATANDADYYYFDVGQAHYPKKFFVGSLAIAENGATKHVESEFYKAFQGNPDRPTVIFLDEITRIPMQASNYLMTIIDNQSYIYNEDTGKRVFKGANVKLVSAGNNGWEYTGTESLDSAFEDRFTKIVIDFLKPREESKLIYSRYRIPEEDIKKLTKVGALLRDAHKSGSISVPISHRQILDAAAYLEAGLPFDFVIKNVVITNYHLSDETDSVRSILQSL